MAKNNYQLGVVDLIIKKFLDKKFSPTSSIVTAPKPCVTMKLPYLDYHKTVDFELKLKSHISSYYTQVIFRFADKTPKNFGDFFIQR